MPLTSRFCLRNIGLNFSPGYEDDQLGGHDADPIQGGVGYHEAYKN